MWEIKGRRWAYFGRKKNSFYRLNIENTNTFCQDLNPISLNYRAGSIPLRYSIWHVDDWAWNKHNYVKFTVLCALCFRISQLYHRLSLCILRHHQDILIFFIWLTLTFKLCSAVVCFALIMRVIYIIYFQVNAF